MTDEPVLVRPADGNDLEGIVAVGRVAWSGAAEGVYPPEVRELVLAKQWTKDALIPTIRAGRTFVAAQGTRVVGMASYGVHDGRLVVWKIHVLPEVRGQGVGGRLLEAVYERAADGHDVVWVPVTDGNEGGEGFLRRHGYVEDHREDQGSLPDLIWMRRPLRDDADERHGRTE